MYLSNRFVADGPKCTVLSKLNGGGSVAFCCGEFSIKTQLSAKTTAEHPTVRSKEPQALLSKK